MRPGEEIVLTDNDKPIARIISDKSSELVLPEQESGHESKYWLGAWKGKLRILGEGDDVVLDHFKDYLP